MNFASQSTFNKIDYSIRYVYFALSLICFIAIHLDNDNFGINLLLMVPCVLLYPYFLLSSFVKSFSPNQHPRPLGKLMPHFEVFIQVLYMIGFYFNPFDVDMRIFWLPHGLISILFLRHFQTFKSYKNEN